MLTDARTLPSGARLGADVAIVGAGPAGITLATELAGAGMRVCLLESAGRQPARATQRFAGGDSVGSPYYPLDETRVRGFGGTSSHWFKFGWFRGRPLEHLDFEQRPGIPDTGWPLDRSDLDRYYERAHVHCGLGDYDYRTSRYVTDERPELPFASGPLETIVFKLSHPNRWRDRFDDVAGDDRIDLVVHATVVHIETGPTAVTRLHVLGPDRNTIGVEARAYVLAAGGIENPRILLLSTSDGHPDGLGNRHDLVGRYFMEHPRLRAATIIPSDPDLVHHTGLYDRHRHDEEGVQIHGKLSVRQEIIRDEGLLNATFFVQGLTRQRGHPAMRSAVTLKNALTWRPLPQGRGRHVANLVAGLPAIAATAGHELRRRVRRVRPPPEQLQLEVMAEQAPNPDSRIVLGDKRDPLGLPLARLDWHIGDRELHSVRRMADILEEELRDGGHGTMRWKVGDHEPVEPFKGGWHHIGTTRMDPDPRRGVVDVNGRLHGVDNLFVAGSSLFPSGGYANPTLTVVALACRLAERIVDEFA